MSDPYLLTPPFFALYTKGQVTADQVHDFIEIWHESGDEEQRSLSEYLGMTEEEYSLWLMDDRTLPLCVRARRGDGSICALVADHLAALRAANAYDDKAAIHARSHWAAKHPPA